LAGLAAASTAVSAVSASAEEPSMNAAAHSGAARVTENPNMETLRKKPNRVEPRPWFGRLSTWSNDQLSAGGPRLCAHATRTNSDFHPTAAGEEVPNQDELCNHAAVSAII
jgi:hypothetical protein